MPAQRGRHLRPSVRTVATPSEAKRLYKHPRWRRLDLDRARRSQLIGSCEDLRVVDEWFAWLQERWRHRDEGQNIWANMIRRWRKVAGQWVLLWFGDCEDWCLLLILHLVTRAGFPRGALRLCACEIPRPGRKPEGHMVVAVATDRGTLVCDPLQDRPRWADDPVFAGHDWHSIEDPPEIPGPGRGVWRSLRVVTLEDALRFHPQS